MKYLDPFLEHRRAQEEAHAKAADIGVMSSLISVELNITELCNRACVFCPRVDPKTYPSQNLHMDIAIAEKVARDLASIGSHARISFSGFGESLLHKGFTDIIRAMRAILPVTPIETNTNGDRLTAKVIRDLFEAGLTNLYVNLYDGPEQAPHFDAMFKEAGITSYKLRDHWSESFGLTLNNRSGMLQQPDIGMAPLAEPMKKPCYYPFYKMIVDWNGDVLFCSNDWGREIIVGNVQREHLKDIWLSEAMTEIRDRLASSDRSRSPCNKCSVEGTLHGKSSFDRLMAARSAKSTSAT
jgi:radical SAM protein with 4Fe4S-binding SPASM domain